MLDANGNIALADEPYSTAQDVASACRTFLGEVYYDTTLGVPWLQGILGKIPPAGYVKAALAQAALSMPRVASAAVFLTTDGRVLGGQVQVTTNSGAKLAAPGTVLKVPR